MNLSKTAYVILGMLQMGRRTGYEIKSLVDVSTRFFWAASYGQIYPELKRLEDAGLIRGEPESTGGRQRRAYTLAPAGERALHEWLTAGPPLHFELRHEGMLRMFFSDSLDAAERADLLRGIRREHERVRDELESIRPGAERARDEKGELAPIAVLDFGIAYQEFIAGWCARAEARLTEARTAAQGA